MEKSLFLRKRHFFLQSFGLELSTTAQKLDKTCRFMANGTDSAKILKLSRSSLQIPEKPYLYAHN